MKILIIGKGGREHALAWKFSQSARVKQIFVASGNPGCEWLANVSNVPLTSIDELLEFAQQQAIDLTMVGNEEMLVNGIVDRFKAAGLAIFGPDKQAAQLEGCKAFAKEFMNKYGVKTAKHYSFTDYGQAVAYLNTLTKYPVVIKASGLAAGKGVVIAQNNDEAEQALAAMLLERRFGESGNKVVIEEYLVGVEASILAVTDSHVILPLISAKDHKRIGVGETGPNTGGMGAIAPNPYVTEAVNAAFIRDILTPTLRGIKAEGLDFAGVIFFGLMITADGVYLLEYNMRMGDPETQVVLPLLNNNLLDVIEAALERKLATINLSWADAATCCIVLAANGYPQAYKSGVTIHGLTEFKIPDCQLFIAGVAKADSAYVTSGGRVVNIVASGHDLPAAIAKAYSAVKAIDFAGVYYRNDIGKLS